MRVQFVAAPFDATAPPLGALLRASLGEAAYSELDVVVAWVKRSGLRLLAPDLRDFRDRGGRVRAIIGVDERGATRQGLELIRGNADEVLVYREPAGGTFHPKVYVFRGDGSARVIVGSSNVTRGGLFDNYEASICVDVELPGEAALLESVDKYIELLRSQTEVALELNDSLLARLSGSPLIQDEDRQRTAPSADSESRAPALPFGRVSLRKAPAPSASSGTGAGRQHRAVQPAPRRPGRLVAESDETRISGRWTKRLSKSDAQQTPSGTNVTGELRLTQAGHPIDQTKYFRDILLSGAAWRRIPSAGSLPRKPT